ncbi:ATP-grasp fold amidoligase family protein [Sinomicrobium weinanense]|uniref:ATP-grasp fold amidoligase family protein n=1 Tax=Sinomicrobium weinanense TaxID=2842200 RepID=UPI001CAA7AE3|nr:ATP-grasp fold amidoligase family protein [Sinomicrobium weinanense]
MNPLKALYDFYRYQLLSERAFIKKEFKRNLGYKVNLNDPKTFNEKLQWLKLYDRTEMHTRCADKVMVREYVADKIGNDYLIPLYFFTDNINDLHRENFPEDPVIIKTNHDSGSYRIVLDRNKADWESIRSFFRKRIRRNYYTISKEWQYKNIRPKVLVEKLLLDNNNNIPKDYKFHCFNGKVEYIQVDTDRQKEHKRNLYNLNWEKIPVEWIYANDPGELKKPDLLNEMLALAKSLSEDFIYVRIDFYEVGGKVYFGEITFHSESGMGKFNPEEYDHILGEKMVLPVKN